MFTPVVLLLCISVAGVYGEQICSVCCWEDKEGNVDGSQKTCRMCVHDLDTCPRDSVMEPPVSILHQGASGPPGRTSPSELHAAPGPQYGGRPGSQEADMSEGLAGPPSDRQKYLASPGYRSAGIVLPEGPHSEQLLRYSARPGTQPGAPAYGSAPAPSAPGWRAYPPGTSTAQGLIIDEDNEGTSSGDKPEKKSAGVAFSVSLTHRVRASRKDEVVSFDSVLTNFDSGSSTREKSFDPETGKFTCFVPGHYFFNIDVKKLRGAYTMKLQLMKNDDVIARVESSSYTDTISATSIVHLDKDDVVYMRLGRRYTIDKNTSFSGHLLYAD